MSDVFCPKCSKGTLNEQQKGVYICDNCSYETDEKEIIRIYVQRMQKERERLRNNNYDYDDEYGFDRFTERSLERRLERRLDGEPSSDDDSIRDILDRHNCW